MGELSDLKLYRIGAAKASAGTEFIFFKGFGHIMRESNEADILTEQGVDQESFITAIG